MEVCLPFQSVELVSDGIDYLTITHKTRDFNESAEFVGDVILKAERDLGNYIKPWSGFGYEGLTAGQFAMGSGPQGYIARASGDCARENWLRLLGIADNVSRVDVQATVRYRCGCAEVLTAHQRSLELAKPRKGRVPKLTTVRDNLGGFTIYVGSRSSEWFGRIYDKFAESGDDYFRDCVRYEIEVKGRPAKGVCLYLRSLPSGFSPFVPGVLEFFEARGADQRYFSDLSQLKLCCLPPGSRRGSTDIEDSLRWLENQVKPSVQRLIDAGRLDDVKRALGFDVP